MILKPGDKIGRLTVVKEFPRNGWLVKCECGEEDFLTLKSLHDDGARECLKCEAKRPPKTTADQDHARTTHGMSGTPTYKVWSRYKSWGQLAPEWEDFLEFFEAVGARPTKEHRLYRDNLDEPYGPGNARWVTATQVPKLYRRPAEVRVEYQGKEMTLKELADKTGISKVTLNWRIQSGLTPEQAVAHSHYEPYEESRTNA